MKKIFILSLLFLPIAVWADGPDFSHACGNFGYDKIYALFEPEEYVCANGEYLPADSLGCEPCPNGYLCDGGTYSFNARIDQGAILNTFTCNSGQFLPANTHGCATCPTGYQCDGGTFDFNPTQSQGLVLTDSYYATDVKKACASNFIHKLVGLFEVEQYQCAPGTYLPADAIACETCPANYYCGGGTYTYNETTTQGLSACGSGLFSPAGSVSSSQCTHILNIGDKHIYLRTTVQTVPSLRVDIDNDGVADYFANMTTTPVPMSAEYAELQSGKYLVIEIAEDYIYAGNVIFPAGIYYVYDDTVTVPE